MTNELALFLIALLPAYLLQNAILAAIYFSSISKDEWVNPLDNEESINAKAKFVWTWPVLLPATLAAFIIEIPFLAAYDLLPRA